MGARPRQSKAGAADVGKRLDVVAAAHFGVSRSSLSAPFDEGAVLLNGKPAKPRTLVSEGDEMSYTPEVVVLQDFKAPDLKTVYEDDDLVIIDKPAGLNVHATEHGTQQATVADFSKTISTDSNSSDRPGIVHRLDKDTSGLLIIAKTGEAKEYLQGLFRDRQIKKRYLALASGRLKESEATINLPIGRHRKRPTERTVLSGGRSAVTHYRVLAEYPGATLVDVTLETGRTHQIRVHFAHLGHAIVGDKLYGHGKPGLERQFLHAAELRLVGPHGQKIEVTSALPPDLRSYLSSLGEVPEGV